MTKPKIFVSHSTDDDEWCRALIAALKDAGFDTWYDQKDLGAGSAWLDEIERELQAREVFLVIISPSSWASGWVHEELRLAFTTKRRVIPIRLRPTPVNGFILTRQWINAVDLDASEVASEIILALGGKVRKLAPITALIIEDVHREYVALRWQVERIFRRVTSEFDVEGGRQLSVEWVQTRSAAQARLTEYAKKQAPLIIVTDIIHDASSGVESIFDFVQHTFFHADAGYFTRCPLIVFSAYTEDFKWRKRPNTYVINKIPRPGESVLGSSEAAVFDCLSMMVIDNS